jgi:GT2 family glycosyltransferase
MGNQENIDRLLSYNFWSDASPLAETVYICSQIESIRLKPKAGLMLEYSPVALGCAGARQHMVNYHRGRGLRHEDILVFLDDDIEITETGWLNKLIAPLFEGYHLSGVEGRKLTKQMPRVDNKRFDYLSGGRLAVLGEVFDYKCAFDMQFNPNYWEDADFSYQAKQHGFKLACVGDIGLKHLETVNEDISELLETNRAKFYAKWGLK